MISSCSLASSETMEDYNSTSLPNYTGSSEVHLIGLCESSENFSSNSSLSPHDSSPDEGALNFEFLIKGVGISIVASLGIFGNTLSALVLSRPQMKSSVTCLLLALAFCDTLLISLSTLIFSLPAISDFTNSLKTYRHIYYPQWVPYLFPISITAQTGSVYLTLAVTIERYVAVCHPLRARSLCTWRRARICVLTVFSLSTVYNLPRWFEVCTCIKGFHLDLNETIYENVMCELRRNGLYINIYVNWTYLFVMYLIPFTGLVIFNWAIYRQVRKANRERQVLSKLQRREMGLATMLLCVVVVFLLCNILPLVNNILESFYGMDVDQLVQSSNFLVVFNSSVNFVIYCTCGERFRRLLVRLCRDFISCRFGHRDSLRNSIYRKSHYFRSQHGGDLEEVSLGSVAGPHSCLTTVNSMNGNGSTILELSGESKLHKRLNYSRTLLGGSKASSHNSSSKKQFSHNNSTHYNNHLGRNNTQRARGISESSGSEKLYLPIKKNTTQGQKNDTASPPPTQPLISTQTQQQES